MKKKNSCVLKLFKVVVFLSGITFLVMKFYEYFLDDNHSEYRDSIKSSKAVKIIKEKCPVCMQSSFDYVTFFSGITHNNATKQFERGNICSIFGGAEIDLSQAKMLTKDLAKINAFFLFGGASIYVPEDWNVKFVGLPLFGGVENNTLYKDENTKTLKIQSLLVFGGIEINYK